MFSAPGIRRLSLIAVVVLTILACGVSADPTATSPPAPTSVPVQPTTPPQATTVPTSVPEPTAEPTVSGDLPPIEILMVNGYLDTFGSWNVVGLVRNNTDRIIDNVEIEVEIFDAAGASIYVDTTYADLFNIAPGEITPFSYIVFDDLPTADNFVATIVGNSTSELERAFPDITNTRVIHDDDGDTHLTGELVNNGDQPILINSLAGATFDAGGQLLTADSYSVSVRYLEPGEAGPFRISISGMDAGTSAIDSFEVYTDAEVTDPIAPFGLDFSSEYAYVDAYDYLHLVGEVTNNGTQTLNVNLIAAIYDASGAVIDAADVSMALSALAPGESQPYDFDFWGPLNYTTGLLAEADRFSIKVDPYWTWETSSVLIDLTTQDDANEFGSFGGEFSGQVFNNSGGPATYVTIVIYLRDIATGQVLATGYDYIFDEIADGGTADYTVYLDVPDDFDINSAEYFIIVKGERP